VARTLGYLGSRPHTSPDVAQPFARISLTIGVDRTDFVAMRRWPLTVRHVPRESIAVLIFALGVACERTTPVAGRKDTAVPVVPPPESSIVAKPEPSPWDSTAGPALFIAGDTPAEAFFIAPAYTHTAALDSLQPDSLLRAMQIDLFGSGQKVGTARIASIKASARTDSCRTWPTARLQLTSGDTASVMSWNVAFESGHATELAIDSIEGLPTADSARLAADIARIASALPGDTSAAFRGLPFVVNKAWRARIQNGQTLLAAVIVRNVNQEASPRQERILLIAERDSTTTATARFTPRYTERKVGLEETLETTDPISIILLGADRHPTVIVARDTGNGLSYALVERVAGQWQRRWASTYAGC